MPGHAGSTSGNYTFVPIAINAFDVWGPCAQEIWADIGGRIARLSDVRVTAFLKQRLDLAIQRGNAAAVVGTLSEGNAFQGLL